MNITRKDIVLLLLRLLSLVGILYLFTDMVGTLFVGNDYTVRMWFRFKVLLFLTAFASAFLIGTNVLKWPIRQLAYIGYPLYLLVMALGGVFTAPNDLLGYKIGLVIWQRVAAQISSYGIAVYWRTPYESQGNGLDGEHVTCDNIGHRGRL